MDELAYTVNHIYKEGYDEGLKDGLLRVDNLIKETCEKMKNLSYTTHSNLLAEHLQKEWEEVRKKNESGKSNN